MLDGPMPLLRHLELMIQEDPFVGISLHDMMPLLRTLVLNGTSALGITFPWTQLTSLTVFAVRPPECASFLRQTRNLVHCKLHIYCDGNAEPLLDIQLPCLESLTLIRAVGPPVTGFLPTFIVPALRSLEVSTFFLAFNPIAFLAVFVSRCGCRLEELDVADIVAVQENPLSYRQAFPSLRKLLFNGKIIAGEHSVSSDG
ncbi:hypothetical protein DFH06DRAFT_710189 [Mycena polygramma]|nr:hypothetical protein DFH06DRAFT_710189 [Mycena polygramma]